MKWLFIIVPVIIAYLIIFLFGGQRKNVCKSIKDYYTNRDDNPNCYYNPEIDLTITEIIKHRGYPIEAYEMVTDDNYILTILRIKHGKNSSVENKKPVLVFHGFGVNSGSYTTGGNKSLADNGYDVWLGNFRGTVFSKHESLSKSDHEFWNFSLNELVQYDIKNTIDFVYKVTNKKMVFIGYSLSTGIFLSYSSVYPKLSLQRVKLNVALAPIFNLREWKSFFGYIPWSSIKSFVDAIIPDRRLVFLPESSRKYLCLPYPFQMHTCLVLFNMFAGRNDDQLDAETLPVVVVHDPDASSYKVAHHIIQLLLGNDGYWYDYGSEKNLKVYGSIKPIQINLSNMQTPTYLVSAKNDVISTPLNVKLLYSNLTNAVKYTHVVEDKQFTHLDFLHGKDVVPLVYNHVVKFLDDFNE